MMPGLIDDVKRAAEIQQEVEQMNEHIKMREYISYLMHENKKLKKRVKKLEKETLATSDKIKKIGYCEYDEVSKEINIFNKKDL